MIHVSSQIPEPSAAVYKSEEREDPPVCSLQPSGTLEPSSARQPLLSEDPDPLHDSNY
jgi:hypothetical protein